MGINLAAVAPTRPNVMVMLGMLLMCWNLAFTPGAPIGLRLVEVYAMAKRGELRTSLTSKLVVLAGMVLVVAGVYGNIMAGF
ncbi:hypothetical protein L2Y96_11935 [Luteibacter aegosomaticola]|jgi:hypothetical protein|uniref:hypothetical protein n=1 Tax=Luteibacter aegosomaticola TaxID=2911538 RepID=UPI001FF82E2A|nr:hypothetical protein [Luteibacter aegosomaticola]UPG88128.1 hypothetical protein L2Y96_11935 [Luteibacter aegosomaticola]